MGTDRSDKDQAALPDNRSGSQSAYHLVGPFKQLLSMDGLPLRGPISDGQMPVIADAGIFLYKGKIHQCGPYRALEEQARGLQAAITHLDGDYVCIPGLVDSHTHSCFAGSRARDYALRNSGATYLEIAEAGGGIWESVTKTRAASREMLTDLLIERSSRFVRDGITTLEVKSGYGLSVDEELKMLRAIADARVITEARTVADARAIGAAHALADTSPKAGPYLVPTCLAAHTVPRDMGATAEAYLDEIARDLLPIVWKEGLARRVDAFVEKGAFTADQIRPYFKIAAEMGFQITVHADQFSTGGSAIAIECGALSADHLEASGPAEIRALAASHTVATALPGATLGLGCGYTPARALLDAGASLAIASDYNPGSAPMGDLLTQAAILGAAEKITNTEVLAGLTFRAAAALGLDDRGRLGPGMRGDFVLFATDHYNEILYHQGRLRPASVWKDGTCLWLTTTS